MYSINFTVNTWGGKEFSGTLSIIFDGSASFNGYFCGGIHSLFPTDELYFQIAEKLSESSETFSILSLPFTGIGGSGFPGYLTSNFIGYSIGSTASGINSEFSLTYCTDTFSSTSAPISSGTRAVSFASSKTKGYWKSHMRVSSSGTHSLGIIDSETQLQKTFTFKTSTETIQSLGGFSHRSLSACSSSYYAGYSCGGIQMNSGRTSWDAYTWSTFFPIPKYNWNGSGYTLGEPTLFYECEKIPFSTETYQTLIVSIGISYGVSANGNYSAGYYSGGCSEVSGSLSSEVNIIQKLNYSSDTFSTLSSTLGTAKSGAMSATTQSAQFISGGQGFSKLSDIFSSCDKLTFASETSATHSQSLSAERYNGKGLSRQPF